MGLLNPNSATYVKLLRKITNKYSYCPGCGTRWFQWEDAHYGERWVIDYMRCIECKYPYFIKKIKKGLL